MVNKKGPSRQKSVYKYVPGDWICPTCEDLQFRRNQSCRICGTMNPMVLAQELALAAGMSYKAMPHPTSAAEAAAGGGVSYFSDESTTTSSQPTSRFSSKEVCFSVEEKTTKGKGKCSKLVANDPQTGIQTEETDPQAKEDDPAAFYKMMSYPTTATYGCQHPDQVYASYLNDPSYAAAVGQQGYAGLPPYHSHQATLNALNTAYLMQQNGLLLPGAGYGNLGYCYPSAFGEEYQGIGMKQAQAYGGRGEEW